MKYQALDSGTGFSMEVRMPTQNMIEILSTGFSMEIRMPTQNMLEILSTGFRHCIWYGDKHTH